MGSDHNLSEETSNPKAVRRLVDDVQAVLSHREALSVKGGQHDMLQVRLRRRPLPGVLILRRLNLSESGRSPDHYRQSTDRDEGKDTPHTGPSFHLLLSTQPR
jgi:hypothetical protein